MQHTSSFIDLATGEVSLRSDVAPLRPRMTLRDFATSPLAKPLGRGFEKLHSFESRYLVGVYTLSDTDFAATLGFTSPAFLALT